MYDGVRPLLNNTKYWRKYQQTKKTRGKIIQYQSPNGQSLILYPISYLANAINRSIPCIDSWVRRGILPQTPFRYKGYKYYCQKQIDIIAHVVKAFNIRSAVPIPTEVSMTLKREFDDLLVNYGIVQPIDIDNADILHKKRIRAHNSRINPIHYKLPTGEIIPLYSIGVLAQKLSREPQTIKKWELSGTIPQTPFKTTGKFRLYTQDQIDLIANCAETCNIRNGVSIKSSGFTNAVKTGYIAIFDHYGLKIKV